MSVTPELLGSLIDAHGAALRLFARQWCDTADDVVQAALVSLARQSSVPDDPAAWLFRAVRNGALSARRSEMRRKSREQLAASERNDWFEADTETAVDASAAVAALNALPDELREPVVAHLWGGLTFEQIAVVAGISSSTAHRRYEQGLRQLRERMEPSCRNKNL